MNFIFYQKDNEVISRQAIVDFLYEHLIRFRDPKEDINKCLDYALAKEKMAGGFILCALIDQKLAGIVVMIKTGMSGYIPENFLVYIAVDAKQRGQGIGTALINKAIEQCEGDIALHVEYDNPAKKLYERLGFTNKYAEMRYHK